MEQKKAIAIKKIREFWPISDQQIKNLQDFVELVLKVNHQYNLIGKSTESEIWDRHILDSAQLLKYCDNLDLVGADFGSGAGFPGLVLSILGFKKIYLIEKSFRKSQFLEQAKKFSSNQVIIKQQNIEELVDLDLDLIFSRALAPLNNLLLMVKPFLKKDVRCLFLKGRNWSLELDIAKKNNQFIYNEIGSGSEILELSGKQKEKSESLKENYILSYKIFPSVTSQESKVVIIRFSRS